jgi:PucR C-terminal helix-turn-helix domain
VSSQQQASDRGAEASAPRSTPLMIVSRAVAGDGLETVARSASDAIGRPVAIAIPALGAPVSWPPGAIAGDGLRAIVAHAEDVVGGRAGAAPAAIADVIPVGIGEQVVGIVVVAHGGGGSGAQASSDDRVWLEAGAAAAAVAALMQETREGGLEGSRRVLLQGLLADAPGDVAAFLTQARRAGADLGGGAVAFAARGELNAELGALAPDALIAEIAPGRILGLVPLEPSGGAEALAGSLEAAGIQVALSSPRRDPAALHEALREAELLLGLIGVAGAAHAVAVAGQEETFRLLIGVLLRDRAELELLRARTISPLVVYDAEHDTELLATLQAFLAHHGSTSETAEAMGLHRHTVGYRLARAHEVSGLSPHESDGRERLGLGLKAHQILEADHRLHEHE